MTKLNFLLQAENEGYHVLTTDVDLDRLRALTFDDDVFEITMNLSDYTVTPYHLPTEGYVSPELASWAEWVEGDEELTFEKEHATLEVLHIRPNGWIYCELRSREVEWWTEMVDLAVLS